jgi:hypothetical protein
MLYGRRVIEPQQVPPSYGQKGYILNKAFQYKYCWYMITAVAGASLLFLLPAYYFIFQNYQLFTTLAYDTYPKLVEHLDREITWLRFFLGTSFFLLCGVTLILCVRMTRNLLSPLVSLEKHMHQLMLGQWHIPDYKIPPEDDFRDLSMTYDYFYRSLKANTEVELKLLEKLSIDPQNREAYAAWKQLLSIKRSRLGFEEEFITSPEPATELDANENGASTIEFGRKRRAS